MSETLKTIASSLVLVACLALCGFLVWIKADGSVQTAMTTVAVLIAWFTRPPSNGTHAGAVAAGAAVTAGALMLAGCSLFTPANLKTALDATRLACVFASELTDAPALADACKIDSALVPVLDKLIAEREGAKKAGVKWSSATTDAGAQ